MNAIDQYESDPCENIEKSLTNLNCNFATMTQQMEELAKNYKEFSANFNKQQEMMFEGIQKLNI